MATKTSPNKITIYAEKLLANTTAKLQATPHITQPEQEAIWLLQHLLKDQFIYTGKLVLSRGKQALLQKMLHNRIDLAKPLAYILGTIPFLDFELFCKPPILIPRSETESWANTLIDKLKQTGTTSRTVLDLCTGSGCIPLALGKAFPSFTIIGVDIDKKAIALAKHNKQKLGLTNVSFSRANILSSQFIIASGIDLITANPPYVTLEEYHALSASVKNWEDKHALLANNNGLVFYQKIIQDAAAHFNNNPSKAGASSPMLALEMSPWQISAVQKMLAEHGFTSTIINDNFGQERALFAQKIF